MSKSARRQKSLVSLRWILFFWGSVSWAAGQVKAVLDLEKAPQKGETLIWSPLFQASWDRLNEIHGGLPEKVVPPNPLIAKMDGFQWDEEEVMPADGYAVFAGPATPEFADATAKAVKEQFGWDMKPAPRESVEGGVSLYGILVRDLNFKTGFFRSKKKALVFKDGHGADHLVQFFGTAGKVSGRFGDSVSVLAYEAEEQSFALKIATKTPGEALLIYKPAGAMSFQNGVEDLRAALKKPLDGGYGSLADGSVHDHDVLKIPYLKLEAETDFSDQLKGARFYKGHKGPWRVERAYQITRFELFEKGARVRVETGLTDGPFGGAPRKVRYMKREFVCDRSFFVFAWKDDAEWPYFGAWIDGKDALESFR